MNECGRCRGIPVGTTATVWASATARPEPRVASADDHGYVSVRAGDSQLDRLVATEMRRDNGTLWSGNDILVFIFDTFDDRRSSISFTVNPLGGRAG